MEVPWLAVRVLVVLLVLAWLGTRAHAFSVTASALQPYPKVKSLLDSLSFVQQYGEKQYADLKEDVALFFTRYHETFTYDPDLRTPRLGPLPLLYDIKDRVQEHFTNISLRMPSDIPWHLKLQNACRRVMHMLQAYIEDVRERLQLSRYSPAFLEDYYSGRLFTDSRYHDDGYQDG